MKTDTDSYEQIKKKETKRTWKSKKKMNYIAHNITKYIVGEDVW
jgi:hypothetical protein